MELPLDMLIEIGRLTDNYTRVNLCLASKEYWHEARQREVVYSDVIVNNFFSNMQILIQEFHLITNKVASIKHLHKIYRYIISRECEFLMCSRLNNHMLLVKTLEKLDESEKAGMNVRTYKKIMVGWRDAII